MRVTPEHSFRPSLRILPGLALLAAACGGAAGGPTVEDVLARERAAADFRLTDYAGAREALAPLLERDEPAFEDLLRRVNVELADAKPEAALTFLEEARAEAPDDPVVLWSTYRLARADGAFQRALEALERLHAEVSDDYPTRLALANMLEEQGRDGEAEEQYRALLASDGTIGDGWRLSSTYRLFSFLQRRGREEEALRYQKDLQRFEESGVARLGPSDIDRGSFGNVDPPARGEVETAGAWDAWMGTALPGGRVADALDAAFAGCSAIVPVVRDDRWSWSQALWGADWLDREQALREDATEKSLLVKRVERMAVEIAGWGQGGVRLATRREDGWSVETVYARPVTCAAALDLDLPDPAVGAGGADASAFVRDGLLDFVVAAPDGLLVLGQEGGGWSVRGEPLLPGSFAVSDLEPVDFDHDGDLDLLAVGSGGVRLLRNDGFGWQGGSFTDATLAAGLPRERGFSWCLAEDPDGDNDVDLLLGGTGGTLLAENLRGGRFADRSDALPAALRTAIEPLCTDLNADGWPDLVLAGRFFAGGPGPAWSEAGEPPGVLSATGRPAAATPFGEPRVRLLWSTEARAIEARDLVSEESSTLVPAGGGLGAALAVADVDGDGHGDLIETDGSVLRSHACAGEGHAVTLSLQGVKDNRRAVGALVELRAGPLYRRLFWHGEPRTIGLGVRDRIDLVRVTWPNGIVQDVLDLAAGSYVVRQREGLGGSCPFLYTWNGTTFTFVSDVLGITPLGLPVAPGELVPPDHDEYVLVEGDQLRARNGWLELQLTEELREVTYLDRIRLDVVDHPAGTEVHPSERFCFPPFPEPHIHTVRAPLVPLQAVDGRGRDWAPVLAAVDGDYAVPFEPLFGQFLGLATPHALELRFDPGALRDARKLRLVMTGWFYWTDASVNVAAARHPDIAFVPPCLSVPDGEGGWVSAGGPIGFPAGKRKTMVVDVSDLLVRDDPRLLLSSTLQLYWDSIRLAVDDDDAELRVTSLEPASAELWARGFSEPLPVMGVPGMDWFEWDRVAEEPRWNQHPGLYTRYGETLPLLGAVDDRFVIMGSGDALHVRFDAALAPPLRPGFVRDYLVFLDGWAKDRDPNTLEALYVEPLPFHGMSGYPYGDDERFPDDAAHRSWRVEWNTRLSTRWLEPLRPR